MNKYEGKRVFTSLNKKSTTKKELATIATATFVVALLLVFAKITSSGDHHGAIFGRRRGGGVRDAFDIEKYSKLRKSNEYSRFEHIVSFGDAASDIGNYLRISRQVKAALAGRVGATVMEAGKGVNGEQISAKNYNKGRFSEAKIWIDHLSDAFGAKIISYATGYSTVNREWIINGGKGYIPGLRQQVEAYVSQAVLNPLSSNTTLYTVWAGANDLAGISIPEWHKKKPHYTIKNVLNDMIESVQILIDHPNVRAKNILFLSVIPADISPFILNLPQDVKQVVQHNTNTLNAYYPIALGPLMVNDKIKFRFYDAYGFLTKMADSHKKYNLLSPTLPCILSPSRKCNNPHEFFWYDQSHIGSTTHLHMAIDIIQKEFPEAVVG